MRRCHVSGSCFVSSVRCDRSMAEANRMSVRSGEASQRCRRWRDACRIIRETHHIRIIGRTPWQPSTDRISVERELSVSNSNDGRVVGWGCGFNLIKATSYDAHAVGIFLNFRIFLIFFEFFNFLIFGFFLIFWIFEFFEFLAGFSENRKLQGSVPLITLKQPRSLLQSRSNKKFYLYYYYL